MSKDTRMKTSSYSIAEHWDTGCNITKDSDPASEFDIWQAYATAYPEEWSGDEFLLSTFENYIASL